MVIKNILNFHFFIFLGYVQFYIVKDIAIFKLFFFKLQSFKICRPSTPSQG